MSAATAEEACLLTAAGTLDSTTYLELRDSVIKAALDEPPAVLADVSGLDVPAPSAWSVFTSARWYVSTWPNVPILLLCPQPDVAAQIAHVGVTRYVPVYSDITSAMASLEHGPHRRRRARIALTRHLSSLRGARDFVAVWLSHWSQDALIPTAKVIVDILVENVLRHTDSSPEILLECMDGLVTIAVHDSSACPAVRHEAAAGGADAASGLGVASALCRSWGSSPTQTGKTVWAVLGPENRL